MTHKDSGEAHAPEVQQSVATFGLAETRRREQSFDALFWSAAILAVGALAAVLVTLS